MKRKKLTAKEAWHRKYFQEYSDIIMISEHDETKRARLLKTLLSWQENFDKLELN